MNQKGAGLIGLLLVVVIIGLLAYGNYSFWNKEKKIDINDGQQIENNVNGNASQLHNIKIQAQQDIENINKTIASSSNDY